MNGTTPIKGPRFELARGDDGYPAQLDTIANPPEKLFGVGSAGALVPGLAVVGARRATPYGIGCARRFARLASEKGVTIISGGALGCDSEAHKAALESSGRTVAVLGGGCDKPYPARHTQLFQKIVDNGGAIVSENTWDTESMPYMFRERNRIIAGLSAAVLIVEAGLPSGTFSTADEALDAGRDVLVVPGCIVSAASHGSNRLLLQGATPIVDDDSFCDVLFSVFGALKRPDDGINPDQEDEHPIIEAIKAKPMKLDELYILAERSFGAADAQARLMEMLVEAEAAHTIARRNDGTWGPAVPW